jgi:hypothetical protein
MTENYFPSSQTAKNVIALSSLMTENFILPIESIFGSKTPGLTFNKRNQRFYQYNILLKIDDENDNSINIKTDNGIESHTMEFLIDESEVGFFRTKQGSYVIRGLTKEEFDKLYDDYENQFDELINDDDYDDDYDDDDDFGGCTPTGSENFEEINDNDEELINKIKDDKINENINGNENINEEYYYYNYLDHLSENILEDEIINENNAFGGSTPSGSEDVNELEY